MVKVSVIVPVYNTAEYLRQCCDSLVIQTLEQIEVILVDDGSTDDSGLIIDEYQKRYPSRIKSVRKTNGGLSDARNAGLEQASGEYVGFVDSDDWVAPDMFGKLYEKAKTGAFDVVACDVAYVFPGRSCSVSSRIEADIRNAADLKRTMLTIYPVACNKIYRRALFDSGIRFTTGIWYEDCEFLYRLYPRIQSIGTVREALYQYRQNPSSIMHTYDRRLYQFITNFENILAYHQAAGTYDAYRDELEFLYVRYAYATFLKRLAKAGRHAVFAEGCRYAIHQVNQRFPGYRKNPYLRRSGLKGWYLLLFNRLIGDLVYFYESSPVLSRLRKSL